MVVGSWTQLGRTSFFAEKIDWNLVQNQNVDFDQSNGEETTAEEQSPLNFLFAV